MQSNTLKPQPLSESLISFAPDEFGRWLSRRLPNEEQNSHFQSAQICKDISLTHSHCIFSQDHQVSIQYEQPTTLLVFGLTGLSRFQYQGCRLVHIVRPGDIWLINTQQNAPLIRYTPANVATEMVVLKYQTQRIRQAFTIMDGLDEHLLEAGAKRLARTEKTEHWVHDLLKNKLNSATDRLMAEAKALEILARWITPSSKQSTHDTECLSPKDFRAVQHVVDILKRDISLQPRLDIIAHEAGMSHAKLNRCFRKLYGETVFCWLRNYRLNCAKQYLLDPKRNVTQIALNCGFSSASHFTQVFKAEFGCTPLIFRHKNIFEKAS